MLIIGRIAYRREGVDGSAQRGRSVIYDCLVYVCVITFRVTRSRGEMCTGHGRLYVCVSVSRRIHTLLYGSGSKFRNDRGALKLWAIGRIYSRCTGFIAMIT